MIDLKEIKLIVSAVDGVITEGVICTDELGVTLFKEYYFKDFEAINEIKRYFKFVFISKENAINHNLCRRKNIPFYWSKTAKEKTLLEDILPRYEVELSNVIYIGCSYSDEKAMGLSQISVCPSDSAASVKRTASIILNSPGGCGALVDFYDTIIIPNLNTL